MFDSKAQQRQDLKLWFNKPATQWVEAVPIGNGRIAAMVYGKVNDELIKLNESSLWSGGPVNADPNPDAKLFLPKVRELIDRGEFVKATELCKMMQGKWTASYMPVGDLNLSQHFEGVVKNYQRELDLQTAIAKTKFTVGNTIFTREIFTSFHDDVIVIKLGTNKKASLNFDISFQSLLNPNYFKISNSEFEVKGKSPAIVEPSYVDYATTPVIYSDKNLGKGTRFSVRCKVNANGGQVNTTKDGISVSNADEVMILVSIATSFNGFDKRPDVDGKDESSLSSSYLNPAFNKSYEYLKQAHLTAYQQYFNRTALHLNGESHPELPTDERLEAYSKGNKDLSFEALYFQFGRYLLISSSRKGGLPANLQGIWNASIRPPWSSNYTTNINVEMNYWMAESCNLSELHQPLFELIKNLSVTGSQTAKNYYQAAGWCVHHNTDIWATSNPVGDMGRLGDPKWANWAMSGPWLCQHLWEHFQFTGDKDFLRSTAYPLMKGAAQFCEDWLVKSPDGKFLVTSPSVSPENVFISDKGPAEVSMATTMDMTLIRELFKHVIEASSLLNMDEDFRLGLQSKVNRLFPYQIGRKGDLQEWFKDFEAKDINHRHLSHLYGLYPGNSISMDSNPDLAEACKVSLDLRGDEGAGWSKAWKINLRARLYDGEKSYQLLRELLHFSKDYDSGTANSVDAAAEGSGGTYPDLFCAGPPFQIDGNFGGTAGIVEMLLQSQGGAITLLPAIPATWANGDFEGLKARGGFTVSANWQKKLPVKLYILSNDGNICKIRTACKMQVLGTSANSTKEGDFYVTQFNTEKGKVYEVINYQQ